MFRAPEPNKCSSILLNVTHTTRKAGSAWRDLCRMPSGGFRKGYHRPLLVLKTWTNVTQKSCVVSDEHTTMPWERTRGGSGPRSWLSVSSLGSSVSHGRVSNPRTRNYASQTVHLEEWQITNSHGNTCYKWRLGAKFWRELNKEESVTILCV